MRPSVALAAATVLAAIAVPAVVAVRAATTPVAAEAVPAPAPMRQGRVVVARPGEPDSITLAVGPFPRLPRASYALAVEVGVNRASGSFSLTLHDANGDRLAACRFPPGGYRVEPRYQSAALICPVGDPAALESVTLAAVPAEGAVVVRAASLPGGRLAAGALVVYQPEGFAAAVDRLSLARPSAFGAATLLGSLGLSVAALGAAALALLRRPTGRSRRTGRAVR